MNARLVQRSIFSALAAAVTTLGLACSSSPEPEGVGASADPLKFPSCPIWANRDCTNEGLGGSQVCTCDPKDFLQATSAPNPLASDSQCQLIDTEFVPPPELGGMGCTLGASYKDPTQANTYPLMLWACTSFVATPGYSVLPAGSYSSRCLGQPDSGFVLVGETDCGWKCIINQAGSGPCKPPPH